MAQTVFCAVVPGTTMQTTCVPPTVTTTTRTTVTTTTVSGWCVVEAQYSQTQSGSGTVRLPETVWNTWFFCPALVCPRGDRRGSRKKPKAKRIAGRSGWYLEITNVVPSYFNCLKKIMYETF